MGAGVLCYAGRMPIYEYKCAECGGSEDLLQDAPYEDGCPCHACGGWMTRVFSFSIKRSGQEMPPERR